MLRWTTNAIQKCIEHKYIQIDVILHSLQISGLTRITKPQKEVHKIVRDAVVSNKQKYYKPP